MDLHEEIPSLSKTTIYNTLNIFIEADLVKVINIDENKTRYDINDSQHGHFKCLECGDIYDVDINIQNLITSDLQGFIINKRTINFLGICSKCNK